MTRKLLYVCPMCILSKVIYRNSRGYFHKLIIQRLTTSIEIDKLIVAKVVKKSSVLKKK